MTGTNQWMKKLGRTIVAVVLFWVWTVTVATAEVVPLPFQVSALTLSTAEQIYSSDESIPVQEEDSLLVDVVYTTGFFVTFAVVATGYGMLYTAAGNWGALKCTVAEESWNACWHGYMNRVFH